jgi:hypothetical protein
MRLLAESLGCDSMVYQWLEMVQSQQLADIASLSQAGHPLDITTMSLLQHVSSSFYYFSLVSLSAQGHALHV